MNPLWLLLLLVIAAVGGVIWVLRKGSGAASPGPTLPADDLRSLGLTPARPRPSGERTDDTPPSRTHAPIPEALPSPGSVVRDPRAWGPHADALASLLDAFATTVGGPVAVLSAADGVASVDALAEADATPRLPQRRLSAERTAALSERGDGAFERSDVAEDALRAFRAVTSQNPPAAASRRLVAGRLLVVGGALPDATLDIADRYADLLASLIAAAPKPVERPASPTAEAHAPSTPAPIVPLHADRPEPALELVDLDAQTSAPTAREASIPDDTSRDAPSADAPSHAKPGARSVSPTAPVPRAVLLAAEVSSARDAGRPLAFALMTRTDAEAALADGGAQAATVALCTEVALADEVRRAEPFGDLVVGAFLDVDADGARAWADGLEDGAFRVGLVAPADYDAEALRADAEDALRRAWMENRAFVLIGED